MASTIKVDNVQNQPGTNIINKCGTTITVGAACNSVAVTGNVVKSNAVQASDGGNIIDQCGTTITVGASGDTVALAAGASSSGFGRTGAVDWDTTPKTATFSAVNGTGYFVNTTSGVVTANLPAGSAGDIVALSDYASTWDSNAITVSPNGSDKINGGNYDTDLTTAGLSVTLIYIDGTQGWKNIDDATTNVTGTNTYVEATGGTPITCGDYKIHVFTGPGALCVTSAGTVCGSNTVDYLVVAGGGGGGGSHGGGGGGGGLRTFMPASTPMTAPAGLAVPVQPYAITVGAGGASGTGAGAPKTGSDSIFSSITSAGGGGGGNYGGNAADGGSGGGGGGHPSTAGSGNTPSVSPVQGKNGGLGGGSTPPTSNLVGGGGGGANACGAAAPPGAAGAGGDGGYIPDAMIGPTAPTYGTPGPAGSTRYWAGGGGGGGWAPTRPGAGGGAGGGATGSSSLGGAGCNAAVNTSGGGGGGNSGDAPGGPGGSGGSGIVIIRYKFQN